MDTMKQPWWSRVLPGLSRAEAKDGDGAGGSPPTEPSDGISTSGEAINAALQALGLTMDEYLETINAREVSKKDKVIRLVEESSPSFGQFMTKAFVFYEKTRDSRAGWKSRGDKATVKDLRRLANGDLKEEGDIFEMFVSLYHHYRFGFD